MNRILWVAVADARGHLMRAHLAGRLLAADGTVSGEFPLAADPFTLQRRFVFKAVLAIPPRPVGSPCANVAVLAEFGAEFFLLGHPSDGWDECEFDQVRPW